MTIKNADENGLFFRHRGEDDHSKSQIPICTLTIPLVTAVMSALSLWSITRSAVSAVGSLIRGRRWRYMRWLLIPPGLGFLSLNRRSGSGHLQSARLCYGTIGVPGDTVELVKCFSELLGHSFGSDIQVGASTWRSVDVRPDPICVVILITAVQDL